MSYIYRCVIFAVSSCIWRAQSVFPIPLCFVSPCILFYCNKISN